MSTTTPQESPALNAELARLAQAHVENAQQSYSTHFDYSADSLKRIDDVIAQFHADGQAAEAAVLSFGAYVGEAIRRTLGGVWVQDERGVALLQRVAGKDLSASPFSWVQRRFSNGMTESIAEKYSALRQQVGTTGVRIARGPSASASAPAATSLSPEDDAIVVRSPLLVFLLVAAADGKVDKKELAMFEQIISGVTAGATPLLRDAMARMVPELERHLSDLQERDPVEDLKRLATLLDTQFSDQASAFKHTLVAIGIKIAESSGGFLGFGSKISKTEAQAIAGIAVILGVAQLEE
jgi:hypothetical protein